MKSTNRPPLQLPDDEPIEVNVAPELAPTVDIEEPIPDTGADDGRQRHDEPTPDGLEEIRFQERSAQERRSTERPTSERPMSERRRRRMEQEAAQAGLGPREPTLAPSAESAPSSQSSLPPSPAAAGSLAVEMAVPTGKPPAPFELTQPPAVKTTPAKSSPTPTGRHAYLIAGLASALWIGGVASWAAYEFGAGGAELDPLRIAIYALIALAPAGLAVMLAHAVRQGAGLAAETRRARDLAEALVAPTALAARQTGE
ncbi:hypothetical protein LTR94_025302, partial [Friedmanniomyces endolithicus]